ncbi:MAG: sugar phosphate isomerase/epimerase family protein [Planctomycetota bacterium]
MNKIGIMQGRLLPKDVKRYQVFPAEKWEEEFELCRECGFSAMELLFDVDNYSYNPLLDKAGRDKINRLSEVTGVCVSSVCADFFKKYGLFEKSLQVKEGNLFMLKRLIEACEAVRCKSILIPFVEGSDICSTKDRQDIIKAMELVGGLLERYGVNLCFETTLRWSEISGLMEEIGHTNLRVYYDTGNSAYLRYEPAEEIRRLSKWIGGVHIKDRDKEGNNVLLGTGLVDFSACFAALKEIDYRGSYILETTMGQEPVETARMHLKFVKTFL